LPGANGLALATETAGTAEPLAVDGQPALTGADALLPLRLATPAAGTYTLAVDELVNLPAGYRAYLRDGLSGAFTELTAGTAVPLTLASGAPAGGRYALLFSRQAQALAAAPAALAALATVYPNPAHGAATLLLPRALRGTEAVAVTVLDALGRAVWAGSLGAGAGDALELPLAGRAPGVYAVRALTARGLVTLRLVLH
jgi:hypothetical protein